MARSAADSCAIGPNIFIRGAGVESRPILCSSTFERNAIVHRCAQQVGTFGGAQEAGQIISASRRLTGAAVGLSRMDAGYVVPATAWNDEQLAAAVSPAGSLTDYNQERYCALDAAGKLIDIWDCVIVGCDTEYQIIAVAEHRDARSELKCDRWDGEQTHNAAAHDGNPMAGTGNVRRQGDDSELGKPG
jgi:hypothetical protein